MSESQYKRFETQAGFKRGDVLKRPNGAGEARVMAVAEGWVMLRHPGAAPFLRFAKEIRDWELISNSASE
jgi:hypothetical protein